MSFVSNTLNALDDFTKTVDPLGYSLVGQGVADYRHSTEAKPSAAGKTAEQLAAEATAAQDTAAQTAAASVARGRTSTILNGEAGLSNLGTTSKVLLGQ